MKHLLLLPLLLLGSCAPSLETQCENLIAVINKHPPEAPKKEDADALDAQASYYKTKSAEIQTLEIVDQKLKPLQLRLVDTFKQTGESYGYTAESIRKAGILQTNGDILGASQAIASALERQPTSVTLQKETIELFDQVLTACPKKPKP